LRPFAEIISLDRIQSSFRVTLTVVSENLVLVFPRKKVRLRHFVRFELIASALLLAVCAFGQPAYADTITESVSGCSGCNGYTFKAMLTSNGGGNYSLSYTITDVSGAPATAQSWSLTLFPSGNTITSFSNFLVSQGQTTNTSAYSVLVGKSNNGSNGNCNSGLSDAMCVTLSAARSPSLIGTGQSLNFKFDFNCTNCAPVNSWDFLSHGTCATGTGNCYAISSNGGTVAVPEPSVLALLASELALMLGIGVAFRPTRNWILQRCAGLFRSQPGLTS
jgi:hypothetical protein